MVIASLHTVTAPEGADMMTQAGQKRQAGNVAAAVSGSTAPAGATAEIMQTTNRLQSKAGMTMTGIRAAEIAMTAGKGMTADSGMALIGIAHTGTGHMLKGQTGMHLTATGDLSNLRNVTAGQNPVELLHQLTLMNMTQ